MRPLRLSTRTMATLTLPTTRHRHPLLLYGTAWKKTSTTPLVSLALKSGFQGLDTACQPKHYREDLIAGQDPGNSPYEFSWPIEKQVRTSVATSLRNLNTTYLDAVLLHSPLKTVKETVDAWKVLQGFVDAGRIRHLGISNVTLRQLEELYSHPEVTTKPAIVQNRFYAATGFDCDVRGFCKTHGMVWQSFWTLTGNPELLVSEVVERVAEKVVVGREEALYLLVLALGREWETGGVCVLDGTTKEERMKGDLEAVEKVGKVEEGDLEEFRRLIGDLE
ncbi:NADP-dependent oxidoreductase domain-containing protein [Trichophaea hybrida]|nr:NADP-dependent oxidoreductase domain-containing protein [Trichophaea hybrida]